jgi:hypothetical protein
MSISLRWENRNKTVLRITFWNEWTVEEYLRKTSETVRMIESQDHDVDILIDLRTGSYIPKGDSISAFRMMMDDLPGNSGIIVYLNDNPVQKRLFKLQAQFYQSFRRWSHHPLYMVETLENAYQLIEEHRLKRVQPKKELVEYIV